MRLKNVGSILLAVTLALSSNFAFANDSSLPVKSPSRTYQSSVEVLKKHGLSEQVISKLGQGTLPLAKEIATKELTKQQIDNYVKSILKAEEQLQKFRKNREAGIVDETVQVKRKVIDGMVIQPNGVKMPVPKRIKGASSEFSTMALTDGPKYNVDAMVGYNQITHWLNLPQVNITTAGGIVPYVLGGAYVTYDNNTYYSGVDVGAFYLYGEWRLFISDGSEDGWYQTQATIPSGTVHLNYRVSASNEVTIEARDSNYNFLASMSAWYPNVWLAADGSNVEMSTGFSMAYRSVQSISDGSYLLNGHISDAYVYDPNGYNIMDTSVVVHHNIKGSSEEIAKTSVTTFQPHSNYNVSIDFR